MENKVVVISLQGLGVVFVEGNAKLEEKFALRMKIFY